VIHAVSSSEVNADCPGVLENSGLRLLLNCFVVFILQVSSRKYLTSFANLVTERAIHTGNLMPV
jgi:hypothetical protein